MATSFMATNLATLVSPAWTAVLGLIFAIFWFSWNWRCRKRLPPGPRGLPLVGYLFSFKRSDMRNGKCMEWAKKYGPIVRIKLGAYNVIFLNDLRTIKTFLSRGELLHRPRISMFAVGNEETSKFMDEHRKEHRRFTLHVLRNLGFGRISMETHIQEEVSFLSDLIAKSNGTALSINEYLMQTASNVMAAYLFGRGFSIGDPRREQLDAHLRAALHDHRTELIVEFLPEWLKKICNNSLFKKSTMAENGAGLLNFCRNEIAEHKRTLCQEYDRDFTDTYIKKIRELNGAAVPVFTEDSLLLACLIFFFAGTSTVSGLNHWNLMNCAQHPDTVQSRIQKEIDDTTAGERRPKWEDRKNMPYTMACIAEIYRTKASSTIPRRAAEDTFFDEYFIPKGSIVIPNLWAVHRNPDLWKDPNTFRPERFLNEDGSALTSKPEYLISFSVGGMMCPAETLATAEIFLTLTMLLQRFRVFLEEESKFDIESLDMNTSEVSNFRLRFETR